MIKLPHCVMVVTHHATFAIRWMPGMRSLACRHNPDQDTSGRARFSDIATGFFQRRDQRTRDGQSQRLRGHVQGVRVHAQGIGR